MREPPQGRLDKKVVTSWRIGGLLNCLVFICVIIVCASLFSKAFGTQMMLIVGIIIAVVYAILIVGIIPAIRYIRFRYAVDDEEIDIMCGIIVHKRSIIPLIRVQHVDTRQGPIMRTMHLSSVSIATAAGAHEIPGLSVEGADALRDKVAALARVAQEDV